MTIHEKIFKLESFQKQLLHATITTCRKSIDYFSDIPEEEVDWNNILSCASVLAHSSRFEHLEAALRVAQSCLESNTSKDAHKIGAAVILDSLTNRQAIGLAVKRQLLPALYEQEIPFPLFLDVTERKVKQTIFTNTKELYLNKFQKDAYDSFKSTDVVSVSAPTSAGKSFILYHTVSELLRDKANFTIIYIVPTRALISQVERDFRQIILDEQLQDISVSIMPKIDPSEEIKNKIFVFTQERLHWFMLEHPNEKIDYFIVDEAQKISDGYRGILLQQKMEEIIDKNPSTKIIFSSPLTTNPEILYKGIDDNKTKKPLKTQFVAVNQNLIFVSQVPRKPLKYNVELCTAGNKTLLGIVELETRLTSDFKKFAFLADKLSSKSGNIIYMNGAGDAEKIANILFDIERNSVADVPEIKELIDFCKKTIHKDFLLNKVLTKGIAFHYGNMPLLVRQEIERLFEKGVIKYLICTSTLLEGVNLPAKNIFLRKPSRGRNKPLNDTDFWNLAGRAGRLGKEFQGNIFCIEPDDWSQTPSIERKQHEVTRSIDKVLAEANVLVKFIQDKSPRNELNKLMDQEYAFTYFYLKYVSGELPAVLSESPDLLQPLSELFEELTQGLEIPVSIIIKNPGISPIALQNLYDCFKKKGEDIEEYIPIYPEAKDAVDNSYIKVVGNISQHLSGDPAQLTYYHSILVVNWMRGYPLAQIIDSNYKYWEKTTSPKKLDVVIRATMADVEEYARFKFAKYSACYIDILRFYLSVANKTDLLKEIPDLHIWLEFGVSQQTQISLIALGLSRQTAISLSEFIADDNKTKEQCLAWLQDNDVSSLQISNLAIEEINQCIALNT